jgi:hypothetical protein
MNSEFFPADRRSMEQLVHEATERANKNLSVYRENIRPIDPESMETNRAALAELRRIKAAVASQSPGGTNGSGSSGTGNGWSGGGSDGTNDPGVPGEATNYDDLMTPFVPGDGSTPGATVAYEKRTKGGTATLCGFPEYTNPGNGIVGSVPPIVYRTRTLTGTTSQDIIGVPGCVGACLDRYEVSYAGAVNFPDGSCTPVSAATATRRRSANTATGCGIVFTETIPVNDIGGAGWNDSPLFVTSTTSQYNYERPGGCSAPPNGCCNGSVSTKLSGQSFSTLSVPDTEEAAIERAPDAWTPFTTCAAFPCCTALRTERTGPTQLSFTYSACEMRIALTGMPPGMEFEARVPIIFTDAITGESSIAESRSYPATVDGFGDATITVSISPPEAGGTYTAGQPTFAQ